MESSWFNKYFPCLLTLLVAASVWLALSATVQGQQSQVAGGLRAAFVPANEFHLRRFIAARTLPRRFNESHNRQRPHAAHLGGSLGEI